MMEKRKKIFNFKYKIITLKMIYLTFETNIIPCEIEKKISKILLNSEYPYGEITNDTLNEISKINPDLTLNLLCSMKNAIIMNNLVIQYSKLIIKSSEISKKYYETNVIKLSNEYKISPINIIRIILKHRGLTKKKIRKLLLNPNKMNNYDKKQFDLAYKHDIYTTIDEKKVFLLSMKFEKRVENILIQNNIQYKTQKDLELEYYNEVKKIKNNDEIKENEKKEMINKIKLITPDFLILNELYINDKKVNWIDAKNFYGSCSYFIMNKIKKQTQKYIENYGFGCIVFNYGFSSKINFENIICVNL